MLKSVVLWPDGRVTSFDVEGRQLYNLSGFMNHRLRDKLRRSNTPETTWIRAGGEHVTKANQEEIIGDGS